MNKEKTDIFLLRVLFVVYVGMFTGSLIANVVIGGSLFSWGMTGILAVITTVILFLIK
jgi:hypothetical protein